tara:strand:- start:711 stop:1283 length:573 start_codon:yes stop_codon:yes gene_type:complete
MPSDLQVDNIKDASATKTLATLSSSAVTLHDDVVLPSKTITNYIAQTTTISAQQELTNTYQTVTGSLISSYTPTTGADKVFYSVNLRMSHDGDTRGIPMFIPFLDGSALNQKQGFALDTDTGTTSFGDYIYYHTIIDASGWTSGKNVELKAREYSSSYQMRLHRNGNFYDTSGSESVVYNDVYAVIYSIM